MILGDVDLVNGVQNLLNQLVYTKDEPLLFSSGVFWALFLIFIPLYAAFRQNKWQRLIFVTLFSAYFYYKCSGLFVLLMLGTSAIDWGLSRLMLRTSRKATRKACLILSLICSLGLLAYFKYGNFLMWNWQQIVGGNFAPMEIILPVGISFYTFKSISYVVEVYRGRVQPTRTWLEYAFFLSFFPALLAGPIVRATDFLPQMEHNHRAARAEVYMGLWLILLGVAKKAIIADYLAQYNDLIFTCINPETGIPSYSGFECVMGIIGYTMQIYCDFSGYSDMAIGIALIMGFRLAQNFNFPYKARNLTDFWRRWHISLSTWLRDYIYIPLGGNRRGKARTYGNLLATMLIGGLWHGAAWQFIFWGGMHGTGLVAHKAAKPMLQRVPDNRWTKAVAWLVTFVFLMLTFVLFRSASLGDAWGLVSHSVTDFDPAYALPFAGARMLWLILLVVIIVAHALPTRFWSRAGAWFVRSAWIVKLLIFIIIIQLVLELRGEDVATFIYMQF